MDDRCMGMPYSVRTRVPINMHTCLKIAKCCQFMINFDHFINHASVRILALCYGKDRIVTEQVHVQLVCVCVCVYHICASSTLCGTQSCYIIVAQKEEATKLCRTTKMVVSARTIVCCTKKDGGISKLMN